MPKYESIHLEQRLAISSHVTSNVSLPTTNGGRKRNVSLPTTNGGRKRNVSLPRPQYMYCCLGKRSETFRFQQPIEEGSQTSRFQQPIGEGSETSRFHAHNICIVVWVKKAKHLACNNQWGKEAKLFASNNQWGIRSETSRSQQSLQQFFSSRRNIFRSNKVNVNLLNVFHRCVAN